MKKSIKRPSYVDPNKEHAQTWSCKNYSNVIIDGGDKVNRRVISAKGDDSIIFNNQRDQLIEFMKTLSLAHMCDVEHSKTVEMNETVENLFYNGPSPDEVALVEFA